MRKFIFCFLPVFIFSVFCVNLKSNAQKNNGDIVETVSYTGHLVRITPALTDIDRNSMHGKPFVKTRDENGIIGIGHNLEKTEEKIEEKFRDAHSKKVTEAIQKQIQFFLLFSALFYFR